MLHLQSENDIIAFSTERGLVDKDVPYDGFNITWYTDDEPQHIADCRKALCQLLQIDDQHLLLPRQVHDTKIAEVTTSNLGSTFEGIDALITTLPRTCIGVSTADCVPLLMYDPRTAAIAAAHAGWRGRPASGHTQRTCGWWLVQALVPVLSRWATRSMKPLSKQVLT